MHQYRSAHTHYIYKYKGREAAGVGGHAVQEITTRGHAVQTHMRAKKRIMQLMRARLSVLPVMGAEAMAQIRHPDHSRAAPGGIWWQLMTPTLPTSHDYPRAAPAASGGSSGARPPPPNRTGHTPTPPSRPGSAWWQLRSTTAPGSP